MTGGALGFLKLTAVNLKLQFRQGFFAAWIVISVFYILGLYFIPRSVSGTLLPLILLSEPSTFAMIFTGAILLLERDEGLMENLFVTPLSIRRYQISKALALSLPAAVCGLAIGLILTPFSMKLLLIPPAVILTTLFFALYTFIPASRSNDLIALIWRIGLYGLPAALTVLDYFGIGAGWHQYLLPSKGSLVLMEMALGRTEITALPLILALLSLGLGILLVIPAAEKEFRKHVVEKTGAPR